MGRMHDALRKAAEERDRKRKGQGSNESTPWGDEDSNPNASSERPSNPSATESLTTRIGADDGFEPVDDEENLGGRAARAMEKTRTESSDRWMPGTTGSRRARQPLEIDSRVVCFHKPRDPRAEQFRNVRAAILGFVPTPRSVVLTSGSADEGKSLAVANLSAALVEGGTRKVLIIDANLRHPEMHQLLAARSSSGLSEILAGLQDDPASLIQMTAIPGVELLPAGNMLENPGSLLVGRAFSGVLQAVESRYDMILIDSPALGDVSDAAVLAPLVDGVVMVVRVDGPARNNAERALELLETARARVLGCIATNCKD